MDNHSGGNSGALDFRFEFSAFASRDHASGQSSAKVTEGTQETVKRTDLDSRILVARQVKADIENACATMHKRHGNTQQQAQLTTQDIASKARRQSLASPKKTSLAAISEAEMLEGARRLSSQREEQQRRLKVEGERQLREKQGLALFLNRKEELRLKEVEKVAQEQSRSKLYRQELNVYLEHKAAESLKSIAAQKRSRDPNGPDA